MITLAHLKALFRSVPTQPPEPIEPVLPAATGRSILMWDSYWGHHVKWLDWNARKVYGHMTPLPKAGDDLLARMESGKVARFRFLRVENCANPRDMFFAELFDIGYEPD